MKKRHIKTIHEKYGYDTCLSECMNILNKNKWRGREVYDQLPHIGIGYVSWDDRLASQELVYEFEDFDVDELIRLKVIQTTKDKVTVAQYDDHHHDVAIMTSDVDNFIVEGNVIKSKKWYEEGIDKRRGS